MPGKTEQNFFILLILSLIQRLGNANERPVERGEVYSWLRDHEKAGHLAVFGFDLDEYHFNQTIYRMAQKNFLEIETPYPFEKANKKVWMTLTDQAVKMTRAIDNLWELVNKMQKINAKNK